MKIKRMRIFAGPNGSGKTTILKEVRNEISFGIYVNADDIELSLKKTGLLSFDNYQLNIEESEFQSFLKNSSFAPIKRNEPNLWTKTSIKDNILSVSCVVDSYLAADIAEFIRQKLLENNISFTYETVMSHKSKIDFMLYAKSKGFKVYLYYIATASPDINVERVTLRAAQNGHFVAPKTVKNRYYKSLENLKPAITASDTCYVWDNSKLFESVLISKIMNGNYVEMLETENVPVWFEKYVLG